jgi:uncharacterized protein (TIGR02285 family)
MRRWRLGLLVVALLQSPVGAAAPVVTWMMPGLTNDTNTFGDHFVSVLMRRLPGFDHRVLQGSTGRIWHEIQSSRVGICVFNALKSPDRESVAFFSRRPMLTPAYRLYFSEARRASLAPYFDGEGRVDLDKLVGTSLRGGFTASRAYNPTIDGFIAARRTDQPLETMVSTRQLLNLLRAGRLDFAFASPVDFAEAQEGLSSAPIAGAEDWNASFVACSRDKTGQAVIGAIDRLFEDQDSWVEFIEPLRTILSPEDYAVALRSKL